MWGRSGSCDALKCNKEKQSCVLGDAAEGTVDARGGEGRQRQAEGRSKGGHAALQSARSKIFER